MAGMSIPLAALAGLLAALVLAELKTSRPDGTPVGRVHPYRRLMPFVMRSRNESICYYDDLVPADRLLEYVARVRERFEVDVTHCLVAAAAVAFGTCPTMNRFVAGRRLYQRRRIDVTFSMKRKALDREAKLSAVKIEVRPGETFRDLCGRIDRAIGVERSGETTYADREFALFHRLPRAVLDAAVLLFRWLDRRNLLPGGFIEGDGMYTSVFVANLGSLGMGPAYHHLYEWGTCPLFLMAGRIEERPVVEGGAVVARRVLPLRWSYDERIDDGLNSRFGMEAVRKALEDPFTYLGCLDERGADARALVEAGTAAT